MTILLEATTKRYTGLSTDTKPTLATKDVGSLFVETDTYRAFVWGGAAWDHIAAGGINGFNGTNFWPARIDASTHALKSITYPHSEIHGASAYYLEGHTTLADTGNYYIRLVTPNTPKWGHFTWTITSNGITYISGYEGSSGGMAGGARATIHANNRNINCWSGFHTAVGASATVLTDTNQSWTVDALIGMQIFNQTDGSSAFITDNDGTTVTVVALLGGTGNNWEQNDVYEINNSQMVVTVGMAVPTTLGLQITDTAFGGTGFKADVGGGTSRDQEIPARRNETYVTHVLSGSADNIITFHFHWYEHMAKTT